MNVAEKCYREILSIQPDNRAIQFLLSQVAPRNANREISSEFTLLQNVFQNFQSHYSAVLPYNLNWMIRNTTAVDDFLSVNPIAVYDVGARGGDLGEIVGLMKHISYIGFDADSAECDRINAAPPVGFQQFAIYPYFLGADAEWIDFHLYHAHACSSSYEPGKGYKRKFSPGLDIDKSFKVKSEMLDAVVIKHALPDPDLLKIDTQGSELNILLGGSNTLKNCLLVELEVEFIPMYEGQPLFHEIDKHMHENGFELLYLNRVFQNRYRYPGESRGQLVFGDALYARTEDLSAFSIERLAKFAILLCNYGHLDMAFDLYLDFPQIDVVCPGLKSFFKNQKEDSERLSDMNLDKQICWLLHQRRTNQFAIDSDRSWPIR